MTNSVVRYSDAELAEFQALIEKKLEKAREQFDSLQEQILEITENSSDEHGGDWVDDSSINNDVEMLNNMAIRQRMYIQDLENALVRIRNKTYGICAVTGELIDKRRLLAVPTTTKSLAAKTEQQQPVAEVKPALPKAPRPVAPKPPVGPPKVITKIIRKPTSPTSKSKPASFDDEEDDLFENDLFFDDEEDPIRRAVNDLDDIPEGVKPPGDDVDVDVDVDVDLDVDMDMDMDMDMDGDDMDDMDLDMEKDYDSIDEDPGDDDDKDYDL